MMNVYRFSDYINHALAQAPACCSCVVVMMLMDPGSCVTATSRDDEDELKKQRRRLIEVFRTVYVYASNINNSVHPCALLLRTYTFHCPLELLPTCLELVLG